MVMSSLDGAEIQALLDEVAGRAGRYLTGLDERRVAPDGAGMAGLARFDEPLPELADEGEPAYFWPTKERYPFAASLFHGRESDAFVGSGRGG